jgi:hypothetical protein
LDLGLYWNTWFVYAYCIVCFEYGYSWVWSLLLFSNG